MKLNTVLSMVMVMGIISSTPLMATDYVIDREGRHANVNFKASHLGYSYITGRFNDFEGTFSYDADNPSASKVSVTIVAKSLDTNHAERDKALRSADFFEVSNYPTVTFQSTEYVSGSSGDQLKGELMLHGVTKIVTLDVIHIGEGPDPWGGYRSGFEGLVVLKAGDFDLPEWVGDVEVSVNVEGIKQ